MGMRTVQREYYSCDCKSLLYTSAAYEMKSLNSVSFLFVQLLALHRYKEV